jgi:hypothetical protein
MISWILKENGEGERGDQGEKWGRNMLVKEDDELHFIHWKEYP